MSIEARRVDAARFFSFPAEAAQLRESLGLSQRDLAAMLEVDPTTLSRWERGLSVPRPGHQMRWKSTLRRVHHDQAVFGGEPPPDLPAWAHTFPEIVYVAAPLNADRGHVDRALAFLRLAYPDARVVDGTSQFDDNVDWRRMWSRMARSVNRLVVVPGEDGTIGSGVRKEIDDVRRYGIPIEYLVDGRLIPRRAVDLVKAELFTPATAFFVVPKEGF
jgi:transcriptional regulator with XRE-family HTH domain